jgi:predicted DNA-binding transcriptional regulator AlpA
MDLSFIMLNKIEQHLERLHLLQKEVLTFKEGCSFCDFSPSWMYKLTGKRKIPFYKPNGKKIYFLRSELEVWLLAIRISPQGKSRQRSLSLCKKRRATS